MVVEAALVLLIIIQAANEQNVSPQKAKWLYINFLAIDVHPVREYRSVPMHHRGAPHPNLIDSIPSIN